jgi:hypothetical protein
MKRKPEITKRGTSKNGFIIAYGGHVGVSKRLKALHDIHGLSWPAISRLEDFKGIPPSTLNDIAKSGIVPKKWRHRFPGVGAVDNRPRRAIHLENMESAANTINNMIESSQKIEELIFRLQQKLRERNQRK